jgi:hypothetical protein
MLESISPSVGSIGGTLLTALVPGIGKSTSDLAFSFGTDTITNLCLTVTVIEYGKVQCLTNSIEVAAESKI